MYNSCKRFRSLHNKAFRIDLNEQTLYCKTAFKSLYMRKNDYDMECSILNDKYSGMYVDMFEYNDNNIPKSYNYWWNYRSKLIDNCVIDIIKNNIININNDPIYLIDVGVGFDTRFERIFLNELNGFECNNSIYYYEIDLESVINIRKLLHEYCGINGILNGKNGIHRSMYSGSVLNSGWFDNICEDMIKHYSKNMFNNCIIICEGLLFHLSINESKKFIENMCNNFIGSHFICDDSFHNNR